MPFVPKDWKDEPDHTTPITAVALEDMETRLSGYTDSAAAALATRHQLVVGGSQPSAPTVPTLWIPTTGSPAQPVPVEQWQVFVP